MKRSITFAVAAAGLTFALAGCGTGVNAQTSEQVAAVPGYTYIQAVGTDTASTVSILNAMLEYPGVKGYKSGETAKISATLSNNTTSAITVSLSSSAGSIEPSSVTLNAGEAKRPELKIKLNKDVAASGAVPVSVNFGAVAHDAMIPVGPPNSPLPRVKQSVSGTNEE